MNDKKSIVEMINNKADELNRLEKINELNKLKEEKNIYPNDYSECQNLFYDILKYIDKTIIEKFAAIKNKYNEKLKNIENENKLAIKKTDNNEAYNIVDEIKLIENFLLEMIKLKSFITDIQIYQDQEENNSKNHELMQLDEKTGKLSPFNDVITNIKDVIMSYCRVNDALNIKNDYARGMNHAYRVILDLINNKK